MRGLVIAQHLPALREFVDAVQERDPDVISACLHYTPPGRMAEIAAQWIFELLETVDFQDQRLAALQGADMPSEELMIAYRAAQRRRYEAETKAEKLAEENQMLRERLEKFRAGRKERNDPNASELQG